MAQSFKDACLAFSQNRASSARCILDNVKRWMIESIFFEEYDFQQVCEIVAFEDK